ncbi:MAG: hypothetical protein QM765_29620 [Myxococcales bacterium]
MPRTSTTKTDPIDWLLEEEEPSIRYLTLTQLLGEPESAARVKKAKAAIGQRGWAAQILERQGPTGAWGSEESLYRDKYLSTNWMLLVLADLGMTRADPRLARGCDLWISRLARADGGFGPSGARSHLCTTGNMARALVQCGYETHPKVRSAFEWLARAADEKGGWSCFGSGRNLDSWEPLSAFAVYPRKRWTPELAEAAEKGAQFFLERELHRQGDDYAPWYRFHYPAHYYYDVLVGLDCLTALGYGRDPRLKLALQLLQKKRRRDGRWNLDAVHPDVEGGMAQWLEKHPRQAPKPFALETPGEPSKRITLTALLVLDRVSKA